MLKYFVISLAIISVFITGCGSKTNEPQVVEEKLDLEHVKKIEKQEREQEEKAADLLAQEAAIKIEKEPKQSGTGLFGRKLTEKISEKEKKENNLQKKDTKLTATIKNIFKKRSDVFSKKSEPKQEKIETLEIIEPEPKKKSKEKNKQNKIEKPKIESNADSKTKVISDKKFIPSSNLALSSALKLISCKDVTKKMEAIHVRLLETKDINIADRKLRDTNNDSLMPVIHFDFDQIIIKPDYRKLLRQQGPCVLKALEERGDMILQIEGHADERGSDEYNLALGHRRANAVSNSIIPYLSNSKFARIFSYGEEFPLVRGSNKKAWGKNRRVEFTLLLKP